MVPKAIDNYVKSVRNNGRNVNSAFREIESSYREDGILLQFYANPDVHYAFVACHILGLLAPIPGLFRSSRKQ